MAGILTRIFARRDVAIDDAERIYRKLMTQARRAGFYGQSKVPDSYDGRIDLLTLHIAVILKALRKYEKQGERLSQAVYDVMRDDFEVALREEGMSDTGVKRRIKPIMGLFFTRIKSYVEALQAADPSAAMQQALAEGLLAAGEGGFAPQLSDYAIAFSKNVTPLSLGQIALADFTFPKLG